MIVLGLARICPGFFQIQWCFHCLQCHLVNYSNLWWFDMGKSISWYLYCISGHILSYCGLSVRWNWNLIYWAMTCHIPRNSCELISPLSRLKAKVRIFSLFTLSRQLRWDYPGINLVAILCTFSMASFWYILWWFHTAAAYSRWGRQHHQEKSCRFQGWMKLFRWVFWISGDIDI